ncbi:hypothetical protein CQ393_01975 [Stenotrophomonas sp. MYb238]|uniref:hypothetical protein n=1 Tax=Stenotrophomonas sp. MYb238 TaxID=2040281 RepID=UPI0012911C69|nr:hypothetical protein [Stenotrophomonas sp. MYb238]MQP74659.1 hypothetical protein [Stenotrophomonas sp. MYb238]
MDHPACRGIKSAQQAGDEEVQGGVAGRHDDGGCRACRKAPYPAMTVRVVCAMPLEAHRTACSRSPHESGVPTRRDRV